MNVVRLTVMASALMLSIGAAQAQGDAAAGETVFKKCAICHAVGDKAKNKVGPVLNNVFGRQAGTAEGFNYSLAMAKAGQDGKIWTPETLAAYVHAPKEVVPGNKMGFAGLKDQADIDNLIAYLLTFSPNYVPGAAAPAAK